VDQTVRQYQRMSGTGRGVIDKKNKKTEHKRDKRIQKKQSK
jgi:hypothetical protein